jgi:hypothetical protein
MKSIIEKIIEDPSIEVRSWVTTVLISILKYDVVYAIKLFQDLCNTAHLRQIQPKNASDKSHGF